MKELADFTVPPLTEPEKVVVQCSGGVESTTLIGWAVMMNGRENVYPVSFNDDSAFWHGKDVTAISNIIKHYQLQLNHFVCNMPQSDLLEYQEDDEYKDTGFIPGYKLIMNIASMAYAQRVGATKVYIGNMGDNYYRDEDPELIAQTQTLYNAMYGHQTVQGGATPQVEIIAPFNGWDKAKVILAANALNIPLTKTVSCGNGDMHGALHCGFCAWCTLRIEAFTKAGVLDETFYLRSKLAVNNPIGNGATTRPTQGSVDFSFGADNE